MTYHMLSKMYADDISLCNHSSYMTQMSEVINNDLCKFETWLQGNKLTLIVAKTHSMIVSTKQNRIK